MFHRGNINHIFGSPMQANRLSNAEAVSTGKPVGLGIHLDPNLVRIHTVRGISHSHRLVLAHHGVERKRGRVGDVLFQSWTLNPGWVGG